MSKKERKIFDLSLPWGRNIPTFGMSLAFYNPPMIATYSHFGETMLEQDRLAAAKPFTDTLLTFFSHTGTHFDSPIHCSKEAWSIDQVPLDRLWGEGVVVDMPKGELEEIGPGDLENATPEIREGDIVLIDTGWNRNFCGPLTDWDKAVYYATKNPGITREGAQWLIEKKVKVVGVDHLGVDHPKYWDSGDGTWPVHRGLLSNNIPMLQPLGGQIDQVAGKRCIISCAPVNYVRGDAFPVRVLAMAEE
jgi:kynurenine formamidase